MVAWGLEIAAWAELLKPRVSTPSVSFTIDEPYFIELTRGENGIRAFETWRLLRLDVDGSLGDWARGLADEYLAQEEWQHATQPDRPPVRLDAEIISGPLRDGRATVTIKGHGLPSVLDTSTESRIYRTGVGWPLRSFLSDVVIDTSNGPQYHSLSWVTFSRTANTWKGPMSVALVLPLQPAWTGFALNTGFYGAFWTLPFIGLPLFKQHRRRRKGHCPHCNYDLKRDLEHGCPECGWGRGARASSESLHTPVD